MAQLKWSYGAPLKKSYPKDKNKEEVKNDLKSEVLELFDPQTPYTFINKNETENKKDDINSLINDRYLVKRNFQNPFFLDHNYLKDIEVRDQYLLPQISNSKTTSEMSL